MPTKAELAVKVKYPSAVCCKGRPAYQIWNLLFTWCGDKLSEGRTEAEAWKNAAKKVEGERDGR
jgi:hypothetical protein